MQGEACVHACLVLTPSRKHVLPWLRGLACTPPTASKLSAYHGNLAEMTLSIVFLCHMLLEVLVVSEIRKCLPADTTTLVAITHSCAPVCHFGMVDICQAEVWFPGDVNSTSGLSVPTATLCIRDPMGAAPSLLEALGASNSLHATSYLCPTV